MLISVDNEAVPLLCRVKERLFEEKVFRLIGLYDIHSNSLGYMTCVYYMAQF